MTLITLQDGKVVLREGKVGTEQACCCGEEEKCSGPCDDSEDCDPECFCEDGECVECRSSEDCDEGLACCDGKCVEPPFCNETRYFLICLRLAATFFNPAGVSCTCHTNIGDLLLCTPQSITRSQPYSSFCALEVSAEIGPGCQLQNVVVTRSTGGFCEDDIPELVEIREVQEAECQDTFTPD